MVLVGQPSRHCYCQEAPVRKFIILQIAVDDPDVTSAAAFAESLESSEGVLGVHYETADRPVLPLGTV